MSHIFFKWYFNNNCKKPVKFLDNSFRFWCTRYKYAIHLLIHRTKSLCLCVIDTFLFRNIILYTIIISPHFHHIYPIQLTVVRKMLLLPLLRDIMLYKIITTMRWLLLLLIYYNNIKIERGLDNFPPKISSLNWFDLGFYHGTAIETVNWSKYRTWEREKEKKKERRTERWNERAKNSVLMKLCEKFTANTFHIFFHLCQSLASFLFFMMPE